jgi:predicted O-linked N-acetylglucosamine transferase (SPINDLY family)
MFTLDYSLADFAQHQDARRAWWNEIGSKVAPELPAAHQVDRDPTRRIVLGYVSSDFRSHSAALCFMAVMRNHDKAAFEIVCYSCSPLRDHITVEFEQIADRWVDASRMPDDELAAKIRADKIDILIDLAGFTAGNRLAVFARKPAPIAVTAWGNPAGTGSPTTDYVFADPVSVPHEVRHFFPEQIHDLPCFLSLGSPPAGFRITEPPCLSKGYVTYGVYNRINKISPDAVRIWSEIVRATPGSRIVIKHQALEDAALKRRIFEAFVAHGIAGDRIDCIGATSRDDHLKAYGDIDICLDPLRLNGGISTWEAVAMGVPVVAMLGNALASRASAAILTSIGLTDWIGADEAAYIDIALKNAARPNYLTELRREIPLRIEASAAGNPAAYTKAVEDAYRTFWKRYCESFGGNGSASTPPAG